MADNEVNMKGALNPLRKPRLIKYYADWCGPCKRMTPIVDKVCKELGIVLVEVDIDKLSAEEKSNLNLRSIPTYHYHSGGITQTFVGMMSESELKNKLL